VRRLRTFVSHLGYRGGDLILLGTVWMITGAFISRGDPDPGYKVPLEYLGEGYRIAFWWIGGVAAFIAAMRIGKRDHWGWALLIIAPAIRALSYWAAYIQGLIGLGGSVHLWPDAVLWTSVVLIVYRMARRPDIPDRADGSHF
jgi:hypothetical protein